MVIKIIEELKGGLKGTILMMVLASCLALVSYGTVQGSYAFINRQSSEGLDPALLQNGTANCRYGVVTLDSAQFALVDDLGAGWHLDFSVFAEPTANDAEFVPMIRLKQDKDINGIYLPTYTISPPLTDGGLGSRIDLRPGSLWVFGNEPDRGPSPGQTTTLTDDTFPQIYAKAYGEAYNYIKQRDPTARVAPAGLVQMTPGRLQYLDIVWQAYQDEYGSVMPVDVWTMHLYILPEANASGVPNGIANVALGTDLALAKLEAGGDPSLCPLVSVYCFAEHDDLSIFADQVVALRTWMRDHGEKDKPLIITEFSLLYPYFPEGGGCFLQDEYGNCFTEDRVLNFLHGSFNYLETATSAELGYRLDGNRLVQQWLWWSIYSAGIGNISNLFNENLTINAVGQAYKSRSTSPQATINLFPYEVSYHAVDSIGGTVDVDLWTTISNNGNHAPSGPFSVTFYRNSNLTQQIGSAVVPGPGGNNAGMTGCATNRKTVSVQWSNLTPGLHRYWVKVDSSTIVSESNENDNVASGFVVVDGESLFMPISSDYFVLQ